MLKVLFGAIAAALLLGEKLTLTVSAGAVLILGSVLLMQIPVPPNVLRLRIYYRHRRFGCAERIDDAVIRLGSDCGALIESKWGKTLGEVIL